MQVLCPTHAASSAAIELTAEHDPALNAPHTPFGVPYEAKSIEEITAPAVHDRVMLL